MDARILVIEDEPDLARLAGMYLEREGMTCALAPSAEDALVRLASERFDLVILDINLPGMDGFEFLRRLRRDDRVPVVVVSAREADEDVVLGLGLGADEFIVKPVAPRVLAARVQALLRRLREGSTARRLLRFGDFELDPEACVLTRGGRRVGLSGKEVDILVFLASAGGRPSTSKEIYEKVWGQVYGDLSIVGVYIQRLRRKVEEDPAAPRFLETVYGKGYRFNPGELKRVGPWD